MSKQVIIGGVDYTNNVSTGLSYIRKLDYDLDEGTLTIPFSIRQQSFDMFTLVTFKEDDEEVISFTIADDDVSIVSYSPLLYKHEIQLIETTKFLEYFIVNGKTFTQPLDTNEPLYSMYDVITDLLDTTPLSEFGRPRPKVYISSEIEGLLKDTIANEHTFKEQTLRECLDEIVSDLDAIVRLKSNGSITLDFFNETKQFITDGLNKWNGLSTNQNIGQYTTSLESSALNSITDDKQGYKVSSYPSFYGYASPRSTDVIFNYDNAFLPTPYPIYDVKSLTIFTRYTVTIEEVNFNYDSQTSEVVNTSSRLFEEDLNITDRTLERNAYKTLDQAKLQETLSEGEIINRNVFFQENTIVYDYGKPNIDISNTFGLFGTRTAFENTILASLVNLIREKDVIAGYTIPDGFEFSTQELYYEPYEFGEKRLRISIGLNLSGFDKGNIPFRVFYTPIPKEVRFSIDRNFTDDVNIDTTMLVNQSNRIVDLSQFKGNALGRVNKMGNRQKQLSHRVSKLSDSYNIGDYTSDNYIITEKEVIILRDFYQIHYTLSKNFNKISQFTGINSEERQWEIASDGRTLERHLLYKNYCIIKPTADEQTNEFTSNLGFLGKQKVMDSLTNNWEDIKYPNFLQVESITRDGSLGDFILPLNREGGGNTFTYSFTFDNNASVGTKVIGEAKNENLITNLIDRNINSFTKYTDDLGRLDRIKLKAFNTENTYTDYNDVIEEAKLIPELGDSYDVSANEVLFECDLDVRKDSRENLKGTFELQILPNDINVILGENFVGLSPFLLTKGRTLKFNAFFEPLQQNLRKYIPTPDIQTDLSYTVDYNNGYIEVLNSEINAIDHWAITTEDNELLIGFNNANGKKYINFNFLKEREDINYDLFNLTFNFKDNYSEEINLLMEQSFSTFEYSSFTDNYEETISISSPVYAFTLDEISILEDNYAGEILSIPAHSFTVGSQVLDDYSGEITPTLTKSFNINSVTTINEVHLDTIDLEPQHNFDIANQSELDDSYANDIPMVLTKSFNVDSGSVINETFADTVNLEKSQSFVLDNVVYDFQITSNTTYDFTRDYLIGGETTSTTCPTEQQLFNWFNATYDPYDFNVGDIIRARSFRWEYDSVLGQGQWVECDVIYFEVVEV